MSSQASTHVLSGPIRLLYVDDDPILREFASVHLATDQSSVSLAPDGEAAVAMVAEAEFDLILLDLEMPKMNGFEVLQHLRSQPRTRDVPVIVCTGREDVVAIDRAFDAGATSFFVKPINWRLISHQIRYVLRAQRAAVASGGAHEPRSFGARSRLLSAAAELLSLAAEANPALETAARQYASVLHGELGNI